MRVSAGWSVLATAALCAGAAAATPEERLAVIAGANIGSAEDEPLRYAEADANHFRDVLIELGDIRPDRAILTLGGGPGQLLQALTEARGRAAEIQRSGRRVVFLFYFSGHGDEQGLHLPRGTLSFAELRAAMEGVPADLRISFFDACRTVGRTKGVRRGPDFDLSIRPDEPHGFVQVQASSEGEAAQESDELAGAVFTHFLLSGLRGAADADGDGRVTLSELYAYAYRRTLMRTGTGLALQHPAMAADLAGAGEVVISRPASASATLEVPVGPERYLVFATRSAAVMAEVIGNERTRLALPPGRFLVARHAESGAAVAIVDLSWGGRKQLIESEFQPIAREELVLKGGTLELRPRRLEPRLGLELAPAGAQPWAVRAGAALAWSRGLLELELEAAYVGGRLETTGFEGTEQALTGGPSLALRRFMGKWTLSAALGIELRYSRQKLERLNRQRVAEAGFALGEVRSFGSTGPRAQVRVSLPLGNQLAASLGISAAGLFRREENAPGLAHWVMRPTLASTAAIGYSF